MIRILLVTCLTVAACTKKAATPEDPAVASADKLKSRGQQIYMANCTSCHNPNPKLPGSVGPDIAGSSLELIKARLTSATYPAGYKPKRQTTAMPPFPAIAQESEALAAYLNSL